MLEVQVGTQEFNTVGCRGERGKRAEGRPVVKPWHSAMHTCITINFIYSFPFFNVTLDLLSAQDSCCLHNK